MSSSHVDRNLVFGILALQMDFISRDALIAAMHAWVLNKQKPLGQILLEQGALAPDVQAVLDALVKKHLEIHHDDPHQSLAAVGLPGAMQRDLAQFADPDVKASLVRLAAIAPQRPSQQTTLPMGQKAPPDARFEVLRSHAWGGLGEVYVAQDREVNREVALKRLHERYADDAGSRARFLREAEITGGLEHPGIVPVYGLGTSEDGRPHYAMRFIRGETLKEAIARFHSTGPRTESERRIGLRQLLGRFIAVCNAVEYAHSRGVIHRDLKPSNIMLGKYGETLVVDWGLCKALGHREPEAEADERTLIPSSGSGSSETLPGSAIGTPAYMSPEQSEGRIDELGAASDVYSLGATLYTILTGKEPFESSIVGVILGKVQTGDFVPPRERSPGVPRALDAVCLKAMRLLPKDRYPSCAALASDIEHWLADEPVTAFKDPASTRAVRWVRRHRVAAAASAALTAAAFVGLVAGTALLGRANSQIRLAAEEAKEQRDDATKQRAVAESQRQAADAQRTLAEAAKRTAEAEKKRAEESFRQARQAVDRYFTLISESRLIDVPGAEPLRKELLTAALEYYRKLPKADSGDAEVQAELAAANFRMAIIENLMGSSDWLPSYQKGLEITEQLVALKTPIEKFKSFDAGVADVAGHVLRMEPQLLPEAIKTLERSVKVWEQLLTMRPHSTGIRNDLAAMYNVLGNLTDYAGRFDLASRRKLWTESNDCGNRALGLWKALAVEHPSNPRFRAALATQYGNIGDRQLEEHRYTESLAAFREATALRETLIRQHPDVPHYRFDFAHGYEHLTILCVVMRNVRGAVEAKRQELTVREKMVADFPTVTAYKNDLKAAYADALTLVRSVLPQLVTYRSNFLLVFDLYAELKEKQNALRAAESRNTGLETAARAAAAEPLEASYPSENSHLDADGLAPLKRLFDKTPKAVRAQLIDTYLERAKNEKGSGAKTYRSAAAALRWWAGQQGAAVKLLEEYAKETPDDPQFALALVRACRSMVKSGGQAGPKPSDLLDMLFDSLKNPAINGADAWQIIQSIRRLDPDGQLAGPRWDQLLKHENPSVRRIALRGLPGGTSKLKRFAAVIEQSLADTDAGVRSAAAGCAWDLNHKPDQVLSLLIGCVQDPGVDIRLTAVTALAAMGPDAKGALGALRPLVDDPSGEIRIAAARGLWSIGRDTTAIKRLAAEFEKRVGKTDAGDASFIRAFMALANEMDSSGQDAIPALISAAAAMQPTDGQRNQMFKAIRRIDATGKAAIPKLLELVKDESAARRTLALEMLSGYGAEAKGAIPLAQKCLEDPDRSLRMAAAKALCLLCDAPEVTKILGNHLGKSSGLNAMSVLKAINDDAWVLATSPDFNLRDPRRAVELAKKVVDEEPRVRGFWNTLGVAYYSAGDCKAAVMALGKSMDLLEGGDSADWFFLAMAHWRLGEKDLARKWFKAGDLWMARYAADNENLMNLRAEAARDLGLSLEAPPEKADGLAVTQALIEANPTASSYYHRGRVYADLGQWDRAADDLAKAIKLGAKTFNAWYERALVRLAQGDKAGYQAACADMLKQFAKPPDAQTAHFIAWTCALGPDALTDLTPAIALAEKAPQDGPQSAQFAQSLGAIDYRAGRFEEAVRKLEEAELLEKKGGSFSASAYTEFFLAMAHHRLHHAAEARKRFEKARDETDKALKEDKRGSVKLLWNRRATLTLLRREAGKLVGDEATHQAKAANEPATRKN